MTHVHYEHSLVFASLKRIESTLGDTSEKTEQFLRRLDELLYNSIKPILSSHFDGFLLKILGWQWYNHRRKVSHLEKEEFSQQALRYLALPTVESKLDFLPQLKLDRIFLIKYCQIFTSLNLDPNPSNNAVVSLHGLYKVYEDDYRLLGKVRECAYWLSQALEYKAQLCAKYTKLAIKTARQDFLEYGRHSLDDWCMNYILAVNRAIDKCDWTQGALPTMVQGYMKTTRNILVSTVVNTELLETDSISTPTETADYGSKLRALKVFDPTNLAHLANGIIPFEKSIWKT